jgi:hypothetical protein
MKCSNVGLGRKCKIKDRGFKYTKNDLARNMIHLLDEGTLYIADKCTSHDSVLVKESLRDLHFYLIDRRDLENLSGKLKKPEGKIHSEENIQK